MVSSLKMYQYYSFFLSNQCHAGAFIWFLSNALVAMHPVVQWSFSIIHLFVLMCCIYNYRHFFFFIIISLLYLTHWKSLPSSCIHKQKAYQPLQKKESAFEVTDVPASIHPVSNLEQQQQKVLITIHCWTSTATAFHPSIIKHFLKIYIF